MPRVAPSKRTSPRTTPVSSRSITRRAASSTPDRSTTSPGRVVVVTGPRLRLAEDAALRAETVDGELGHVTSLQEGDVGVTKRHAGGCAGVDQVTRFEHHELAQVPDDVVHSENHVRGSAVLA